VPENGRVLSRDSKGVEPFNEGICTWLWIIGTTGSVKVRARDEEPRGMRVVVNSVISRFGGEVQVVSIHSSCFEAMAHEMNENKQKHY
jgi:hypothetical protein